MENIPNKINKDQLIKMEVDKQIYYFHYRGYKEALLKQAGRNLSPTSFLAKSVGLGFLANLDKTNQSFYYVTKDTPSGEMVKSMVDSDNLKLYIKFFAFEKGIKLKNAVFSLTGISGFGKKRKVVKRLKVSLRSLMADIRFLSK